MDYSGLRVRGTPILHSMGLRYCCLTPIYMCLFRMLLSITKYSTYTDIIRMPMSLQVMKDVPYR